MFQVLDDYSQLVVEQEIWCFVNEGMDLAAKCLSVKMLKHVVQPKLIMESNSAKCS